jgi:amino acid transporter/signal transduction histidine kinase
VPELGDSAPTPQRPPVEERPPDKRGGVQVDRLKANVLQLRQVVFQNVANMAPTAAIAYDFPLQAAAIAAGAALFLSNLFALAAVLLIASAMIQFARKLPSAGGFYTYVSRGLGKRAGALSGFVFFLYAGVLPAEVTLIWAGITQDLVARYLHANISWVVWEVLIIAVVTYLAYSGVQRATRIGLIASSIEIVIFVVLAVALLLHPVSPVGIQPVLPSSAPAGWSGILGFGMVYGILNFVGFEAAAPLAEETRKPRRNTPLSFFLSALLLGSVYLLVSFAVVPGWGLGRFQEFAASSSPFTQLASRLWGPAWIFIYLAMTNSSLACALASTNASSRVLYSMGRVSLLPRFFGHVHRTRRTPSYATLFQGAVTLLLAVVAGVLWGTLRGFAVLAITLTIAAMIMYALGNLALPVFYLKEHRDEFSLVRHALLPLAALPLLAYVVYRTVWPVPVYPFNVPAYVACAWIGLGGLFVAYLSIKRPEALEKSGLTVTELAKRSGGEALGTVSASLGTADRAVWFRDEDELAQGLNVAIDPSGLVVDVESFGGDDLALSLQIKPRVSLAYQLGNISPMLAAGVERALRERHPFTADAVGMGADGHHYLLHAAMTFPLGGPPVLSLNGASNEQLERELGSLALEKERHLTAISDVLRILGKGLEVQEAARQVLRLIVPSVRMEAGGIFLVRDDQCADLVAAYGRTLRRGYPYPELALADPIIGARLREPTIAQLDEGVPLQDALLSVACPEGGMTVIVPAAAGRRVAAFIVLSRRLIAPLSLDDLDLLGALGAGVAAAMQATTLATETEHSAAILQTAYAVSHAISRSLDIDETYREIATNAVRVVKGAHCLLLEREQQSGELVAVASSDPETQDLVGLRIRYEEDAANDTALQSRRALAVEDVVWGARVDPEFSGRFDVRSGALVPLYAQNELIGSLFVFSQGFQRAFSDLEMAHLEDVGEQAAIAIHNARLYRGLTESQARIEALLSRLRRTREEERQAFARVVHDDIVQPIVGATYRLEAFRRAVPDTSLDEFDKTVSLLRGSIEDARRVIWELRPPVLDGLGLHDALLSLAGRAEKAGRAQVDVNVEDIQGLSEGPTTALYKIAREALLNAEHHSHASRILISLSRVDGDRRPVVRLAVEDDGVGFDPTDLKPDHYGHAMMEEQAALVGGRFSITSSSGSGTAVEAVVPLTN